MHIMKDILTLLAGLVLGVVIFSHGLQKYKEFTVAGVTQNFEKMGVPAASTSAHFATYFEMIAGVLIILGLLVRIVGPILFLHTLGAILIVHKANGVFVQNNGWELVALIGTLGLLLTYLGAGRVSLDHLVVSPLRKRKSTPTPTSTAPAGAAA